MVYLVIEDEIVKEPWATILAIVIALAMLGIFVSCIFEPKILLGILFVLFVALIIAITMGIRLVLKD